MTLLQTKPKAPRRIGKTCTGEILGQTNGRKIQRRFAEHHRRLTELREQFVKGRSTQTENAREQLSTSTEHIADAATDSYDRDCTLALLSSTQNALYEIDQALKRITDSTYGKCELTGEPIEDERLKAIPWTRFSATAQVQIEARGAGGRVQLGAVRKLSDTEEGDSEVEDEADEHPKSGRRAV